MYGLVFEIIEEWVIEKQGLDTWHSIKKNAGCDVKDQQFLRRSYYPDEECVNLIVAASELLDFPVPDLLEAFGHYVIRHHFRNGYDDLLRCQGSTLRQWLSNLNAMHDHVQKSFPGENFMAPIFWCEDDDEVEGSIQLHYYSLRGTLLVPVVVGIVEELASFHFDVDVKMKQLCLQDDESGSPFTSWRISTVDADQKWKLSPKCDVGGAVVEEDPVDFSNVKLPSKCPFSGKHLGKASNHSDGCTETSSTSQSSLTEEATSPSVSSSLSSSIVVPSDQQQQQPIGLTGQQLRDMFPFHVLVNHDFTIIQIGTSLPKLLNYESSDDFKGHHIQEFLEISRPVLGTAWCWKSLQKLADQHFFMVPKTGCKSLHKRVSMEDSAVKFKSSMVNLAAGRVMFVLAPDARNVVDLNNMGLTMSDLPLLSCQRDTVFLGEYIHQEVDKAHKLDKLSKKLASEKNLSNTLLYNILPKHVADELRTGKMVEPMYHEKITLFYSDIEGFTNICDKVDAWDVIDMLNQLYSVMDYLAAHFKLYKLETIGDAYLCCAGLEPDDYHAERVANFALAVTKCVGQIRSPSGEPLRLRIGIHTGSCTSGVVGTLTPRYCLFGDFVNTTARHESTGEPGRIHCSSVCYGRLKHFSMFGETEQYKFTPRGLVDMKGKGESYTYWLDSGSENNKAANSESIEKLSEGVAKLLAKKSWKMRKYFRRNGNLRDDTASVGGGSTIGSSSVRSSETGDSRQYVRRLPQSDDEVDDDSDSEYEPEQQELGDDQDVTSTHHEVDDLLGFAEDLGYNNKDWTKLAWDDGLSQEELQEKVGDIMLDALLEGIHCADGKMKLITTQMSAFVERIASDYNSDNRYHNFQRACHVLLSADFLWQKIRADGSFHSLVNDSWDRFIIVLSALILDVQHSGVSNLQLQAEGKSAKRGSYQERKSLRHALGVLEDDFPELYDEITFGSPKALNSISRLVLASDIDLFEKRMKNIQETLSDPCMSDRARSEKNQAVKELVIMTADVAHYSQDNFRSWTNAMINECIEAHSSGRGPDPRIGWCSAQVEFLESRVMPLISQVETIIPPSSFDLFVGAEQNLIMCRQKGDELVKDNRIIVAGIDDIVQAGGSDAAADAAFQMLENLLKEVVASNGNEAMGNIPMSDASIRPAEEMQMSIPMKQAATQDKSDISNLELPPDVRAELWDFVKQVSNLYRSNHFHSFDHALNVSLISNLLLESIQETSNQHDAYGIISDPLARFAVVLSGLVHDVDHAGVPNGQLAKENPELASTYKNKSIAEQHSIVTAWDLLMDCQFQNLRASLFSSKEEAERLRMMLINLVMATDIFDPDLKHLRSSRWEKAFLDAAVDHPVGTEEEKANIKATIVIEHIVQAADVAHTMQDWSLYTKWNEKLFKEMYEAYREGRAEKDPSEGWFKGELWFFDNWVLPLAEKLKECNVFGAVSHEFIAQAKKNRRMWEVHGEDLCQAMLERVGQEEEGDSPASPSSRTVEGSLSVVLESLVEIRRMRALATSTTLNLSERAMGKRDSGDAKRTSKILEEVDSIARVVGRFETRMEEGIQSLVEIARNDDELPSEACTDLHEESLQKGLEKVDRSLRSVMSEAQ